MRVVVLSVICEVQEKRLIVWWLLPPKQALFLQLTVSLRKSKFLKHDRQGSMVWSRQHRRLGWIRPETLLVASLLMVLLQLGLLFHDRGTRLLIESTHGLIKVGAMPEAFRLAYDQSYGFFDDVPEDAWKVAQSIHARMFPNHQDLSKFANGIGDFRKVPALQKSKDWNAANFQEEFHCSLSQRIPTTSDPDGPKWVCDPHRLAKKPDCLVYSVGSNGNVMFEKGVHDEIGPHCEIHTFDLRTYNKRNGHFDEALKGYATFHAWGLGTEEQAANYEWTKRGPPIKTLQQTIQELGHEGRTIDIFKIDCEWCEWHTYHQWLSDDVDLRQILVETHNAPMPNARDFFYSLHDHGYVIFSKEANFVNGGGGVEFGEYSIHVLSPGELLLQIPIVAPVLTLVVFCCFLGSAV